MIVRFAVVAFCLTIGPHHALAQDQAPAGACLSTEISARGEPASYRWLALA